MAGGSLAERCDAHQRSHARQSGGMRQRYPRLGSSGYLLTAERKFFAVLCGNGEKPQEATYWCQDVTLPNQRENARSSGG